MEEIRTFIAVALPGHIKRYLKRQQQGLKQYGISASWPKPESFHLTLKFLGNLHPDRLDLVRQCMDRAFMSSGSRLELLSSGIGVFPSVKKAKIIWAGVRDKTGFLEKRVHRLNMELNRQAGIAIEKKRFSPHLTIARLKKNVPPKEMIKLIRKFQACQSGTFEVHDVALFKSRLTASGPVHTQLYAVCF